MVAAGCDLGAPPVTVAAPGLVVGRGDVDGDGDLDLVTAASDAEFGVMVNDGSGGLSASLLGHEPACDPEPPDPAPVCTQDVVDVVDVDGDDVADLVTRHHLFQEHGDPPFGWTLTQVWLGDGAGGFELPFEVSRVTYPEPAFSTLLRDATGDGIVDVVEYENPFDFPQPEVRVRVGDGTGGFGLPVSSALPGSRLDMTAPRFADLDGDGDHEMVLDGTCVGGTGEVFLQGCIEVLPGDGAGGFGPAVRHLVGDPLVDGVAVDLGDVDGDGDLDVVGGARGVNLDGGGPVGQIVVFLGDGVGGFEGPSLLPAATETVAVELADFDVDGHLDAMTRSEAPPGSTTPSFGRVLFGDGAGHFGDEHVLGSNGGLVLDLDGDGRPDQVVSRATSVSVYLNRWDGRP